MNNGYGYDLERDRWSRRATEEFFPAIALEVLKTKPENIIYAWNDTSIDRLDTNYGVDALLHSEQRHIAIAIRIRGSEYYHKFGDVTIRLDSLQTMGKMLEMQKSIARFMFYAWGDTNKPFLPTKFIDWHIIYLQQLVDLYLKNQLKFNGPFSNRDWSSRLVGFNVDELKKHNLIYQSFNQINSKPKPDQSILEPKQPIVTKQPALFDEFYLEAAAHEHEHSYYND